MSKMILDGQGESNGTQGYQPHRDLEYNQSWVKSVRSERYSYCLGSSQWGKDDLLWIWTYINNVKHQNCINLNQAHSKVLELAME